MSNGKNGTVASDKLGWGSIFGYSVGDMGMAIFWLTCANFITYFMTNIVGMAAGLVGTGIMVTRVFDAFSDVTMGTVIDRTRSRYGKARPWLIRALPPLLICFVLLFAVPEGLGETGTFIWFIVFFNLTATIFYTMVNCAYQALNPLMTRDQGSRLRVSSIRMVLGSLGGLGAGMLTIPIVTSLGGDKQAWITWVIIVAAIMMCTVLLTFFTTKERYSDQTAEKIPFNLGKSFKILFKNKYWVLLTFTIVVFQILGGATGGAQIYYFQYIVGDMNAFSYAAFFTSAPAFVIYLLAPVLARKFSKGTLARVAAVGSLAAPLLLLIAPTSVPIALARAFLQGIFNAPFMAVNYAMVSDVADYTYWKQGVRSEGLATSGASFGIKVGVGVGAAMVGWALGAGGFDASLATQPDSAIFAINFLMIWVPVICGVLATAMLLFYKLDKEIPAMRDELQKRDAAETAAKAVSE